MLDKLLTLRESRQGDKFASRLYQSGGSIDRRASVPTKGNKAIEREVISSYQAAQRLGFNGDFCAWEHLLRVGE